MVVKQQSRLVGVARLGVWGAEIVGVLARASEEVGRQAVVVEWAVMVERAEHQMEVDFRRDLYEGRSWAYLEGSE